MADSSCGVVSRAPDAYACLACVSQAARLKMNQMAGRYPFCCMLCMASFRGGMRFHFCSRW